MGLLTGVNFMEITTKKLEDKSIYISKAEEIYKGLDYNIIDLSDKSYDFMAAFILFYELEAYNNLIRDIVLLINEQTKEQKKKTYLKDLLEIYKKLKGSLNKY